ncbi:MAG: glucose 1-dehydrogenase [Steroidobacteraceae bacterium]
MTARMAGKAAFISGGASGIGAATARLFVEEGALVTIADINVDAGHALARDLGPAASFQRLDVTDDSNWRHVVDAAAETMGRFDVLVNAAGIAGGETDIENVSLEAWNRIIAINLSGTMLGCQHAVRTMKRFGKGGSIINLSSVIGIRASRHRLAYGASKAAVLNMTKSIALHCGLSGYNIRCNAVHPGPTDTPILDEQVAQAGGRENLMKILSRYQVLQRVAAPRELASAILYLASDDSAFVTGTGLVIDGGFTEMFADAPSDS